MRAFRGIGAKDWLLRTHTHTHTHTPAGLAAAGAGAAAAVAVAVAAAGFTPLRAAPKRSGVAMREVIAWRVNIEKMTK